MADTTPTDQTPTLTLDEAIALLERHEREAEAKKPKKPKKPTKVEIVKDLIAEGAKQGRAGLNAGASRQLEQLEKEGY